MKKFTLLASSMLLAGALSYAQPSTLTFEEAAKIALEQNIGLRQQQNNRLSAEATVSQRFGQFTPLVSASIGGNSTSGLQFNNLTGELTSARNEGFGVSVDGQYTLFNGFARQNLYRQAQNELAQQVSLTNRQEEMVLFDLASQYLQVLLDKELLKIAERNAQEQRENLQVITAQVEAGIRPISDQYDTESSIKNLEITLLQSQNTLANDEAVLIQTLQLEPGQPLSLAKPSWDMDILANVNFELQSLYSEALISRADYLAQKSAIDGNRLGVKVAKADYLPSLSIRGSVSTGYSSQLTDDNNMVVPIATQFTNNIQTRIGATLFIPIYNQMRVKANVARSQVTQNNSELTLENMERLIFTEVQQATRNFVTAQQSLTAAKAQLKAAEKAFEIQKERFELGNTDLLTYNQSNTNLVRSQGELVQAEYRLLFQQLLLDYFVGKLDVDSFRD